MCTIKEVSNQFLAIFAMLTHWSTCKSGKSLFFERLVKKVYVVKMIFVSDNRGKYDYYRLLTDS